MEDREIVALYWQRDQGAIQHTQEKYHPYLMKIARGILGSEEDSQESVNDTYFKAWNAMPPHRPTVLATFLGKIPVRSPSTCGGGATARSGRARSMPCVWMSWPNVPPPIPRKRWTLNGWPTPSKPQ